MNTENGTPGNRMPPRRSGVPSPANRDPKGPGLRLVAGRRATPGLIDFADPVTGMHEVKHPWRTRGAGAQPGPEL